MLPSVKKNDNDIVETLLVSGLIDVLIANVDDNDQFFLVIEPGTTLTS